MKAGVAGASGYGGRELLRLLAAHPGIEVAWAAAGSRAGSAVAEVHPGLAAAYPDLVLSALRPEEAGGLDVVFLALPHGGAQEVVPALIEQAGLVVDLSGDFRLRDPAQYPLWYGREHPCPELLAEAVFGLPELGRDALVGARLVAAAGCYVTAASLALAPLVSAGAIEPAGIVVDAASGVTGAGRSPAEEMLFGEVDEDFRAYGLLTHRHTPEMEQVIGAELLFTPHLAPMARGILATCYARPAPGAADPLGVLALAYEDEPFVQVSERPPSTRATIGCNSAHVTARHDPRTGWVVAICALDNLVKGAAGQAVQCANLALGLPEGAGLPVTGALA